MHHMRIPLDVHERIHSDRAWFRHATDIVPPKIDEHDMLGPLLLIRQKSPFHLLIFFRRDAAAARAGDGAEGNHTVLASNECFGRGADKFYPCDSQIIHIGRGIHHTQGAIELQRRRLHVGLPSLGENGLDDIAGSNILLRPYHHLLKVRLAHVRGEPHRLAAAMQTRTAKRTFEPRDHAFDPFRCRSVGGLDTSVPFCCDMRGGHDLDLLGDIVEDQHRIGEEEGKVRKIERVLPPGSQILERAHHVVAQISDGAADERGKVRHGRRAIALHHLPQTFERVSTAGNALLACALHDNKVAPVFVDDDGRTTAEKRVACPFLTSLNALKKIG